MTEIIDITTLTRSLDRRRPTEPSDVTRLPTRARVAKTIPPDIKASIEQMRANGLKLETESEDNRTRNIAATRAGLAKDTAIAAAESINDSAWAVRMFEALTVEIKAHFGIK